MLTSYRDKMDRFILDMQIKIEILWDTGLLSGVMVQGTKENGKMDSRTVKGNFSQKMETLMKGIGKMIKQVDLDAGLLQQKPTQENG